jgi:flagellar hook assembly protein FlgD
VTLTLHDAAGRRVRTLVTGAVLTAGPQEAQWNGRDDAGRAVRSGVYYCHLVADGEVRIGKLLLLR